MQKKVKTGDYDAAWRRLDALKMDVTIRDPMARVAKLYEEFDVVVRETGVELEKRRAVKVLVAAVRPMALRAKVKAELKTKPQPDVKNTDLPISVAGPHACFWSIHRLYLLSQNLSLGYNLVPNGLNR